MADCLFCKIVAKQIPNYTVWEDENVLAFLDIHPCAKGHTVVIPKKHFGVLEDMTAEDFAATARGLAAAAQRVVKTLKPDGFNIGINNGKAAGQAVGHVHWHIFPRWEGDGGGSAHSIIRNPGDSDVAEVAKLFA